MTLKGFSEICFETKKYDEGAAVISILRKGSGVWIRLRGITVVQDAALVEEAFSGGY